MKSLPLTVRVPTIAVVVPAHDEVRCISACLAAIERSASIAQAAGYAVEIIVVCDACTDGTADIVRHRGHRPIEIGARNVGRARAVGAHAALARGAVWLAFTDADTLVARTWLIDQVALRSDVVCGTVGIHDWDEHDATVRARYDAAYQDRDDHRHIHGANLGIAADAYRRVGGFMHLTSDEDVGIVAALADVGASIAWSAVPRVWTSARKQFRAPRGFGAYLAGLAEGACPS